MCSLNADLTNFVIHETADLQVDLTFCLESGEISYAGEHSLSSHRRALESLRSKGLTFSSVSA